MHAMKRLLRPKPASGRPRLAMARSAAVALALVCLAGPALAQMQMVNPFAGRIGAMGPRNMAPYGSRAGVIPHVMQSTNGMAMSMRNSVAGAMNTLAEAVGLESPMSRTARTMEHAPIGHVAPGGEGGGEGGEIEGPEVEVGDELLELVVGACAGGAFIGAFAAATAVPALGAAAAPAAAAAAPLALTALASAMGIGCAIGVVTATVSVGAVLGYREAAR
jgi:hypothetical protein